MYKMVFFVPVSHVEEVKEAVFAAGAGKIGDYEACSWQIEGEGQFRPSQSARPFIGEAGKLERVAEFRVELVCDDAFIKQAVTALKGAHPYEEPAYDVWKLEDF